MKKRNDVSIRIRILGPILIMVIIMIGYLVGSMNGFRLMNNNAELLKEQGMEKTQYFDEVNLQAQIMMKLALAYCVSEDGSARERIWNEVDKAGTVMSENLAGGEALIITEEGKSALANLKEKVSLLQNSLSDLKSMADSNDMQGAILFVNTTLTQQSGDFDIRCFYISELHARLYLSLSFSLRCRALTGRLLSGCTDILRRWMRLSERLSRARAI